MGKTSDWDCMQNSVKILHVHRHTTNNACRAELGKYHLITKIQKRAIQFWKHLKHSDPQSYHYKALQYQEMSKESKPFLQLIQSFSPDASLTSTDALNHNIRTNQITAQIKQSYITWQTQTQQQSKMQWYLSLRESTVWQSICTQCQIRNEKHVDQIQTQRHKLMIEGQTQTNMAPGAEIVFTLWPESDGNRTALPDRVLQIHRYTDSVLRQNTADPSHIYNSSRPGETSVSARRTRPAVLLLNMCLSVTTEEKTLRLPWADFQHM